MPRFLLLFLLLLGSSASAAPPDSLLGQEEEPEFLPVEQAFVISAELADPKTARVKWDIAEGYYLYRHQLRFKLVEPPGFALGEAQLPDGLKKHDEYFGDFEAYYDKLEALSPIGFAPFSGHSARVGAAEDMAAANIGGPAIQLAGGWKSPTMPARYARKSDVKNAGAAQLAALRAAQQKDEAI